MTYACPKCGKPCLTQAEAASHCATTTCPDCRGTGKKPGGFLEPGTTCPKCKGSGRV